MNKQDKFNFFVPLNFEKGSGPSGEMKFKGIASSATIDSDEEVLFPSGFNFRPLMEKGFINWNHQTGKTSSAIIGRPTKAEVINNGRDFYIEGSLYKSLEEARNVYNLAEALEEAGDPNRKLGFSIEGTATKRDILNPKKVLEATITGVAITASPKNPNTLMSIVKGEYSEPFVEENQNICPLCGNDNSEGNVLCKCKLKAMTAEAGEHVTSVEDVEHNPKDIVNKSVVYEQIVSKYNIDNIEKAKEIYSFVEQVNNKLYNNMDGITNEALKKSFEFLDQQVVELQKSKEEKPVEKEEESEKEEEKKEGKEAELEKSEKGPEASEEKEEKEGKKEESATEKPEKEEKEEKEEVKKSEDEYEGDDEMDKACSMAKENLSKGMERDKNVEEVIRKGISLVVAQTAVDKVIKEAEELEANGGGISVKEVPVDLSKIEKSIEDLNTKFETIIKSIEQVQLSTASTLKKSEEFVIPEQAPVDFAPVEELIKSQSEGLNKKFTAVGEVLKSIVADNDLLKSQLEEVLTENTSLREKVNNIEKSSQGRKSVIRQNEIIERFEKSEASTGDVYSLSNYNDRKALNDRLFAEYEIIKSRGKDDSTLEKAISELEIVGSMSQEMLPKLKAMGITITK